MENNIDTTQTEMNAPLFRKIYQSWVDELHKLVIGNDESIRLTYTAMLARGHVMFTSVPGLVKTVLADSVGYLLQDGIYGKSVGAADKMPADVVGSLVFDEEKRKMVEAFGEMRPNQHVVLLDEINRNNDRTNGALLTPMADWHINIGGTIYPVPDPFFVISTQNPIEEEGGTFKVPPAALDRFMLSGRLTYVSYEEELALISNDAVYSRDRQKAAGMQRIASTAQVRQMSDYAFKNVKVSDSVKRYIITLIRSTRPDCKAEFDEYMPRTEKKDLRQYVEWGTSPRSAMSLVTCSKVSAAMDGRDYVTIDDVRSLFLPVIAHRMIFLDKARSYKRKDGDLRKGTGILLEDIVEGIFKNVPTAV